MRPFTISYSSLKAFEQCPRKFYHLYVAKDAPKEHSAELQWGNEVHSAMESRLRDGVVLPAPMEGYERFATLLDDHPCKVELKLGIRLDGKACGFFDNEVWVRGKVDVSIVYDNLAAIFDWKTGKKREDPDELEIFGVMLKALHPQLEKITGHYVWLKEGTLGGPHDLSDTPVKLAQVRGRYEKIVEALRFKHFPENETPLCGWCPIVNCRFNPKGQG